MCGESCAEKFNGGKKSGQWGHQPLGRSRMEGVTELSLRHTHKRVDSPPDPFMCSTFLPVRSFPGPDGASHLVYWRSRPADFNHSEYDAA